MTAPSHGIVGVSSDGGSESLVGEYSATSTGDVAVWSSRRLTSGTHTVRVRITGSRQSASTHDCGTIDRLEISSQPAAGTNYHIVYPNSGKPLAIPGGASTLIYVPTGKALGVNGYSTRLGVPGR